MANLQGFALNPDVKETGGEFTVVPPDHYEVCITIDRLKDTKSGEGKFLELTLEIMKGEYAGVEIIDRLNLLNPSEKAQQIGQGTLRRITSLCGQNWPIDDTRRLWGIPLRVKVGVQEFESNTSGETLKSNEVRSYSAPREYEPPIATQATGQARNKQYDHPANEVERFRNPPEYEVTEDDSDTSDEWDPKYVNEWAHSPAFQDSQANEVDRDQQAKDWGEKVGPQKSK